MKFKAILLCFIFLGTTLTSFAYELSQQDISVATQLTNKITKVIDSKNKDPEQIITTIDSLIQSGKYSEKIEGILNEIAYNLENIYFSTDSEKTPVKDTDNLTDGQTNYQAVSGKLKNNTPSTHIPEKHLYIWNMFSQFFPNIHKDFVISYIVSHDTSSDEFGSVGQIEGEPKKWDLSVNLPSFYKDNTLDIGESTWTLIHEGFHIASLNENQIKMNYVSCTSYEVAEGCPNTDSYFQGFINTFWPKSYTSKIGDDNNLFELYPQSFVTQYASTNPGEDIAESFTFFVLNDKPTGDTVREKKMLFFYNYPELVSMRDNIRVQIEKLELSKALNVSFE